MKKETLQEQIYRLKQLAKQSKPLNNSFVYLKGNEKRVINL